MEENVKGKNILESLKERDIETGSTQLKRGLTIQQVQGDKHRHTEISNK